MFKIDIISNHFQKFLTRNQNGKLNWICHVLIQKIGYRFVLIVLMAYRLCIYRIRIIADYGNSSHRCSVVMWFGGGVLDVLKNIKYLNNFKLITNEFKQRKNKNLVTLHTKILWVKSMKFEVDGTVQYPCIPRIDIAVHNIDAWGYVVIAIHSDSGRQHRVNMVEIVRMTITLTE